MRTSTNYGFKLPEGTDNVKRQDLVDNFESIDTHMKELATQSSDLVYQVAGGTATALTLTTQKLVTGYAKTFIASANNGGAATTINTKKLFKPATTSSPILIAGKAYTVWYNSTGDSGNGCFFIKASGEGDVIPSEVLATKKFTNDNESNLVGTMPNNGALSSSLNCGASYTIPLGYTSGGTITTNTLASQTVASATANQILYGITAWINGTKVTGTMVNHTGVDSTVNSIAGTGATALFARPQAGYYSGSEATVVNDANFIASNIISGKSIFGLAGSATIVSLGGKKHASGYATSSSTTLSFDDMYSGSYSLNYLAVGGLDFTPETISIYWFDNASSPYCGYWSCMYTFPGQPHYTKLIRAQCINENAGGYRYGSSIRATGNAAVTYGSFIMPIMQGYNESIAGRSFAWEAFGS